jgi:hypothetical protein
MVVGVMNERLLKEAAMYPHIKTGNESMADRSVNIIFERFAALAAKLESGDFTQAQFAEYDLLHELLRNVVLIADCQYRRYLQPRVN